jgi:hypothetical protein
MKIRAIITLLPTDAGGRQESIKTGYITLVGIAGLLSSASIHLQHVDVAHPGETHEVELRFADPQPLGGRIRAGARITLNEGRRSIGEGKILEVEPRREQGDAGCNLKTRVR